MSSSDKLPIELYRDIEPRVKELFASPRKVLLATHGDADADGVGAAVGLARGLSALGHTPTILLQEELPEELEFVDPEKQAVIYKEGDPLPDADLILALDAGEAYRLGPLKDAVDKAEGITKALVDHHLGKDDWFDVDLCIAGMSSTGELAYYMLDTLGAPMDEITAKALYIAMAEDSGFFCYDRVKASTFEAAAKMVDAGADPYKAFVNLRWCQTPETLRTFGAGLAGFRDAHNGLTNYLVLTDPDLNDEVKHMLADTLLSTRGVEVTLVFTPYAKTPGTTKLSLRGKDRVSVQQIAKQFGGGGHRLSAGARFTEPVEEAVEKVLAACEQAYMDQGLL